MINIHDRQHPTNVAETPPQLSAAEIKNLKNGLDRLAELDAKFAEIDNLREAVTHSGRLYAQGQQPLEMAVALAAIESGRIAAVRGALRASVKSVQRDIIADLAPLITRHREHVRDDIARKCEAMEAGERANAGKIGITESDYRESGLLLGLRETLRRAEKAVPQIITRSDLHRLAKAVEIEIPETPGQRAARVVGEAFAEALRPPADDDDIDLDELDEVQTGDLDA
jgi:hypothetical protein